MSQLDAEDRERAVQALTKRNAIQKRIDSTQERLRVLQDIVQDIAERETLLQSLTADQAALLARVKLIDEFKGKMHREEERIRWKTQEALRSQEEWKSRHFSRSFPSDSVPPNDSQTFGFFLIAAMIVLGMLILLR